jgi:Zn-dependent protease
VRPTGPGRLQIARLLGIPIYVHFSWLIVFVLVVWTLATGYFPSIDPERDARSHWLKGLVASLLFFVSILLHELGHAAVALRRGIGIRSITLFIFGGVADLERDPPDGRTEFVVAAAGLLVSVALAGLFYASAVLLPIGDGGRAVARYLCVINVGLTVFNLVPAFPLDGGRLLRGILWSRAGKARATRIAARAGTLFAYVLIASGLVSLLRGSGLAGVWYVLIGWFLKNASAGAQRMARMDDALRGLTVQDAMVTSVETLPGQISLAEAAREHFMKTGFGAYPVVRGDDVIGLVSLRDILSRPAAERERTSVQSAAAPLDARTVVSPDLPLAEAVTRMAGAPDGRGRVLVMEAGRLVGLLTMSAVARHLRVRAELAPR